MPAVFGMEVELRFLVRLICAGVIAGLPLAARAGTPDIPEITVSKPWIRYLLPNIPAGGYMVLQNSGGADAVLTGASSPDCSSLMLHKSDDTSGTAMMMDVQSIEVPAGGKVTFASGGYHLMCMDPKMAVGQRVPVTLNFQGNYNVLLTMPVYGPSGSP